MGIGNMEEDRARWSIEELGQEVASPDRFAGGGVVAAMSLVGAAATAELVFQLCNRRRDLSDAQTAHLGAAIEQARKLRERFLAAVDADMESLTELMKAQRLLRRARKKSGGADVSAETIRMQQAVDAAIATPLRVAGDAAELLGLILELHTLARPFTASDLGAAAATIQGAISSLLLMAEVNLGMVDDQEEAGRLKQKIDQRLEQTDEQARTIITSTRHMIANGTDQDG